MPNAAARKRKRRDSSDPANPYNRNQRKQADAAASSRLEALAKLIARKDKSGAGSSLEALRLRAQLAETCAATCRWKRSTEVATRAIALDAADPVAARRLLAPVKLRLGHVDEAAKLLVHFADDNSTAMAATALLTSVSMWITGRGTEAQAEAAFERCHRANWHLALLLSAVKTAAKVSDALDATLRVYAAAPSEVAVAPGGIEEALLLATREFGGWARDDEEEDEEAEEEEAEGEEGTAQHALARQLRGTGVAAWMGAALLRQPPPETTGGVAGDAKRFVRLFENEVLETALDEVTKRVAEAGEGEEEEGEEEEGEEEEGEDEEGEDEEGVEGRVRQQARSVAALEAWKAERREALLQKRRRAQKRAAAGGDGHLSSGDESDEGEEEGEDESEEEDDGEEAEEEAKEESSGSNRRSSAGEIAAPRSGAALELWKQERRRVLKAKQQRAAARAASGGESQLSDEASSGEEDEAEDEDEDAVEGRVRQQARSVAALEAWKAERREALLQKRRRAQKRAATGGDGHLSSGDESDEGDEEEGVEEESSEDEEDEASNGGQWRPNSSMRSLINTGRVLPLAA